MQSGREDTLEKRYAIKSRFKLEKKWHFLQNNAPVRYSTLVTDNLTYMDFHGAFQKLLERYNKCIAAEGDYFEGY